VLQEAKKEDETGWTVVDKKAKKAGGNYKEDTEKANRDLNNYLKEF